MATDVKARFATGGTATSTTALAAEQDPADGAALTLTAAAATFAQADDGSCTVQKVTLTSGSGRAFLFSFPLLVNGISAISTKAPF